MQRLAARLTHPAGRGIRLGLVCALLCGLLAQYPLLRGVEDWMLDACSAWRGLRPTHARVVIVGIDDPSLDALKKPLAFASPELARVVAYLKEQKAAAVGLDLFVPATMKDLPEIETEGGVGDARTLGQAIADAGNVVLPQWRVNDRWETPLPQWRLKEFLTPDPGDLAFVNLTEDPDQFVRRQQLLIDDDGRAVPHLALALFARARDAPFAWQDGRLTVGGRTVPLDEEQKLRIHFVGPPGTFPVLPFREVLRAAAERRPNPELAGAIVLIGVTSRGQQDYHPTPFANGYTRSNAGLMAGTEIQAHVLATLEDRVFITTPWWLNGWLWLLLMGAALGHAFTRLSLEAGFAVATVHHFAWKGVALAAFALGPWRVEVVAMLLLGVVAYGAAFALRWRVLRRMMGVVKSEAVARELEIDPRRLDPGGEEREVTVVFTDIRGFTAFSDGKPPAAVVALLNAYFSAMVPIVERAGGTVDKFIGDGLMILFGAPASREDHAVRAVRTARAMVRRVHELGGRWLDLGFPGMRIGVGVHTGKVVVGAIGSRERVDYTAIGATVNAASRIESSNKEHGTEILVSAATRDMLAEKERAEFAWGEPVAAQAKGIAAALTLYPLKVD